MMLVWKCQENVGSEGDLQTLDENKEDHYGFQGETRESRETPEQSLSSTDETQQIRLKRLQRACDKYGEDHIHDNFVHRFVWNEHFKAVYCPIEKVASSTWNHRMKKLVPPSTTEVIGFLRDLFIFSI